MFVEDFLIMDTALKLLEPMLYIKLLFLQRNVGDPSLEVALYCLSMINKVQTNSWTDNQQVLFFQENNTLHVFIILRVYKVQDICTKRKKIKRKSTQPKKRKHLTALVIHICVRLFHGCFVFKIRCILLKDRCEVIYIWLLTMKNEGIPDIPNCPEA